MNPDLDQDQDQDIQEEISDKVKKPKKYFVILLNDDFTHMDFVIEVLQRYFGKSIEEAHEIMLNIHHEGRGVCGLYTKAIAETKSVGVNDFAKANSFPLKSVIEPESDEE